MNQRFIQKTIDISRRGNEKDALVLQKELLKYVNISEETDAVSQYSTIAGIDLAYSDGMAFAAIVLMDRRTKKVLEIQYAHREASFPYITGLLTFREFPAFHSAFLKLSKQPDVLLFDGQGIAHPRKMGIATQVGILLGIPSFGCAKSHLYGDYEMPEEEKLSCTPLTAWDTKIGYVLRTREGVKPVFISAGHMITPDTSLAIAKEMTGAYKLPLPTHYADKASKDYKRKIID